MPCSELPRPEWVTPPYTLPGIVTYLFLGLGPSCLPPSAARQPSPPRARSPSPLVNLLVQVLRTESFDFIVHTTGLQGGLADGLQWQQQGPEHSGPPSASTNRTPGSHTPFSVPTLAPPSHNVQHLVGLSSHCRGPSCRQLHSKQPVSGGSTDCAQRCLILVHVGMGPETAWWPCPSEPQFPMGKVLGHLPCGWGTYSCSLPSWQY